MSETLTTDRYLTLNIKSVNDFETEKKKNHNTCHLVKLQHLSPHKILPLSSGSLPVAVLLLYVLFLPDIIHILREGRAFE